MEAPDRRAATDATPGPAAETPGMAGQTRAAPGRDSGECHCVRVTKLQDDMASVKMQLAHLEASFGAKQFIPGRAEVPSAMDGAEVPCDKSLIGESLPLKLGPMGSLASGRIFDLKIAGQDDFQFSSKGGDQWKGKTERYLISVVPACYALFH